MGAGSNKVHEAYAVAPAASDVWEAQEPDVEEDAPPEAVQPAQDPSVEGAAEETEAIPEIAEEQVAQ